MERIISLEPSSTAYREGGHDGVLTIQVDNGPPRLRKDRAQSNPVVDIVWETTEETVWSNLMFGYAQHRGDEMHINMVSELAGYATYRCRLVPGTFSWRLIGERGKAISCSVEVLGVR